MTQTRTTKARLVEEIHSLRLRLQEMEAYRDRCRQAEEALRQSDSFYETFLENTGTATIIIEEDTTISMLNVEFEMVTGYARDEMVGHTWTRHVAQEDVARLLSYHRKRRSDPESAPRNYEFKIKTRDGELRDVYMTIAMIPGTKLSVASMLDITERKQLEKEILNISERERQKIGRELHDDLGQHLIGIEVMTKVLKKTLEDKALEEANHAEEINILVKEAIGKTRRLARGLCPVHLVSNGLEAALEDLASSVSAIFKIACTFTCPKRIPVRDNTRATHLYYIVKESIHNAIEHGKASRISIKMVNDAGTVSLTIRDNGIGIRDNANHAGLGLRTMLYRAKMIDASLAIEPAQTGGTVVSCIFDIGRAPR